MSVVVQLSRIEAAHLTELVRQFADLLDESAPGEQGLRRLAPDAYPDDDASSREYRRLTEADALRRRHESAERMIETLSSEPDELTAEAVDADAMAPYVVTLDAGSADAWLRTMAALRLVLASRLGIEVDDTHDDDDPRFAVYDWIGFRLDELVRALD